MAASPYTGRADHDDSIHRPPLLYQYQPRHVVTQLNRKDFPDAEECCSLHSKDVNGVVIIA